MKFGLIFLDTGGMGQISSNTSDDMTNQGHTLKTVKRIGLVEQVIQQIQAKISEGEFHLNEKIPPEPVLMRHLGVGRSTLREAIRVMVSANVLEVRQGDGTYVRKQPEASEPFEARLRRAGIQQVYQVRRIIEIEIASLAAENRTNNDIVEIQTNLAKRQNARNRGDNRAYLDADIDFHMAIAASTKNPVLKDLFVVFSNALRDCLEKVISDPLLHDDKISLHEPLFQAIKDGDAEAAKRWTALHVDTMLARIREVLG
jgi:DNA-binding FadR family transcriptional regulator